MPEIIGISGDFIKLDSFLKFANAVGSGGMAKILITDGEVSVNGRICLERGRKLRNGDTVSVFGKTYEVRNVS